MYNNKTLNMVNLARYVQLQNIENGESGTICIITNIEHGESGTICTITKY